MYTLGSLEEEPENLSTNYSEGQLGRCPCFALARGLYLQPCPPAREVSGLRFESSPEKAGKNLSLLSALCSLSLSLSFFSALLSLYLYLYLLLSFSPSLLRSFLYLLRKNCSEIGLRGVPRLWRLVEARNPHSLASGQGHKPVSDIRGAGKEAICLRVSCPRHSEPKCLFMVCSFCAHRFGAGEGVARGGLY